MWSAARATKEMTTSLVVAVVAVIIVLVVVVVLVLLLVVVSQKYSGLMPALTRHFYLKQSARGIYKESGTLDIFKHFSVPIFLQQ